jgi:hypothetical protein
MNIVIRIFALIGLFFLGTLIAGLYFDATSFDQTKGGYEAPYTGVTGEPVDWDSMDLTSTGLVKRGHIINVIVNGTTGMISFEIFKRKIDWRVFSERALILHKPKEAFIRRGFKPEF